MQTIENGRVGLQVRRIKQKGTTVHIHKSCPTELKNSSRPRKQEIQSNRQMTSITLRTRAHEQNNYFDFKSVLLFLGGNKFTDCSFKRKN